MGCPVVFLFYGIEGLLWFCGNWKGNIVGFMWEYAGNWDCGVKKCGISNCEFMVCANV